MSNALKKKRITKPSTAPLNLTAFQIEKIAALTGVKLDSLRIWQANKEREIRDAAIAEFSEKLYKAEEFACFMQILTCMYAIKLTWGFKKSQARFVENLGKAQDVIDEIGWKEAYNQLMKEVGTVLEFDGFDTEEMIQQLV